MKNRFDKRWIGAAIIGFLILLSVVPLAKSQTNSPTEYQLKAAFLFNFAKFIDWPPGAFTNDRDTINLCVLGDDPFGVSLDELVRGKTINEHRIAISRTRKLDDLRSCHIVFISSSEDRRLVEILGSLKGVSALVVGESAGFALRGGGIQFYIEDGKVRFYVNVDAVQRAHLAVSAKLLALATIVHDDKSIKGG